jgi:hypothetical protein
MVAYSFRMPAGIPGEVNRITAALIEAQVQSTEANGPALAYGLPMIVSSTAGNIGNVRQLVSGDSSVTAVYGFLVRPFPTNSSQDPLGTSTPPTSGIVDILKHGYMNVLLQGATAATKGGSVFIYIGATSTAHPFCGGIEAATSSNAILLPSTYFMGPADSNSITEIGFNI